MGTLLSWPDEPQAQAGRLQLTSLGVELLLTEMLAQGMAHETDLPALEQRREPGRGIATHKLESSEGWLIEPEEIEQALAAARPETLTVPSEQQAFWQEWLSYLERARSRGIRVS